mgnify:CR=1 FL=1
MLFRSKNRDLSGKIVLDIGANIGDSSINFARKGARVISFEPLKILHEYLKKNVTNNNLGSNIDIHYVGLSNKNEKVNVWIKKDGTACASPIFHEKNMKDAKLGRELSTMELVAATDYITKLNLPSIDILKMDCEGSEYNILTEEFLNKIRPKEVMMEYHLGPSPLIKVFKKCGYKINLISKHGDNVGLIFAEAGL